MEGRLVGDWIVSARGGRVVGRLVGARWFSERFLRLDDGVRDSLHDEGSVGWALGFGGKNFF